MIYLFILVVLIGYCLFSCCCSSGDSENTKDMAAMNNRANQMNPNNMAYYSSRGSSDYSKKAALNNRANQLNPSSLAYKSSRKD